MKTMEEVLERMKVLDRELKGTGLENLIAFNHTYFIITRNVYTKLGTGFFKRDDLMKKIDINFANYYFDAFKNYLDGELCPPAWQILFEACEKGENYQFIYMAMGVNAHVNNDLPQTLKDVLKGDTFQDDFRLINDVIRDSLAEVVESIKEKDLLTNKVKNTVRPLYAFYLNSLIQNWRDMAWKNYEGLFKKEVSLKEIEDKSSQIANVLAGVTKKRHIHQIFRVRFD